ncbi:MAG: endonuclease/exonuclease/phosphatase family protein [Flavobacteriales bacterium]|nr:endonuclease/exonuclease/phosphatase family protein [Flavobacteriales bacterium]
MSMDLRLAAISVSLIAFLSTSAQTEDLINLEFGTLENFDVATWNIEFFPKDGQNTIDYMVELVEELELDVIAIQEIDNAERFQDLIDLLQGYDGFYQDSEFLGLGYLYNNQSVEVNAVYNIYEAGIYGNPFPRRPMVMELTFMGEHDFVIINNHFKCCGNGFLNSGDFWDEETRRAYASELLKEYMDTSHQDDNVIMLGDLNDLLTDNVQNNVFQVFYDSSNEYLFADQEIAEGSASQWSFPSWPSHLDHILISNELYSVLEDDETRIETIQIDDFFPGGFNGYEDIVSDHLPVAIGFNPENILPLASREDRRLTENVNLFPNPANRSVFLSGLSKGGVMKIQIINQLGQIVLEKTLSNYGDTIELDLGNQPKGLYLINGTLSSGNTFLKKLVLQ